MQSSKPKPSLRKAMRLLPPRSLWTQRDERRRLCMCCEAADESMARRSGSHRGRRGAAVRSQRLCDVSCEPKSPPLPLLSCPAASPTRDGLSTPPQVLRPEWSCLSFDFIRDELGGNRTRFPVTLYCVAGTQVGACPSKAVATVAVPLMRFPALGSVEGGQQAHGHAHD
jgi:hypothetical protein